ncbi:MAG: DNA-directed RNA polymerase subunit alpha C-terminal domain-containing protein [Patescibacteria group bacterium]
MKIKKIQLSFINGYDILLCDLFNVDVLLLGFAVKNNQIIPIFKKERGKLIEKALATLDPRKDDIVRMRYGLRKSSESDEYYQIHTYKQIKNKYKFSRSFAGQIINKAKREIKRWLEKNCNLVFFFESLIVIIKENELLKKRLLDLTIELQENKSLFIPPDGFIYNEQDLALIKTLSLPVNHLEVSVRIHNCLKNKEVRTIGELVQKTEKEILYIKNLGRKSFLELNEVLNKMGLSLGMRLSDRIIVSLKKLKI